MRLSKEKIEIILARKCITMSALKKQGFNGSTLARVISNEEPCGTKTAGKLARALEVDVTEIIKGN